MRPDWVVDFALTLPGVDTPRIGLPLIDPISAQRRQNSHCMLRAVTTFVFRFHGDAEVIKTTGSGHGHKSHHPEM
jgi:hypothetical protein